MGCPRIHGELLKLDYEIAESTVSKYMIRRHGAPSQAWRYHLGVAAESEHETAHRDARARLFGSCPDLRRPAFGARTRRWEAPLNDLGRSSRCPFYLDCIIATCGHDFREGQVRWSDGDRMKYSLFLTQS
jgi:hypothetical protein